MKDNLTLYRRHRQDSNGASLCHFKYKQGHRPFRDYPVNYEGGALRVEQPNSKGKYTPALDCDCPIVADGALTHEPHRIRYRSVNNTTDWTTAIRVATTWIAQQFITPSVALTGVTSEPDTTIKDPTVRQAGELFQKAFAKKWAEGTKGHYTTLFERRLYPFCENYKELGRPRPIRLLTTIASAKLQEEFVDSWKQLARFKGDPREGKTLPYKLKTYQRWRKFLRYCENKTLIEAMPPEIDDIEPDPDNLWGGLLPDEMKRVLVEAYKALDTKSTAYHRRPAEMDIIILMLLIESGVRISDAATIATENLVPFEHKNGNYLLQKVQWKHREKKPLKKTMILNTPISDEIVQKLDAYAHRYGIAGTDKGKRPYQGQDKDYHYYFWNPQTAKSRARLQYLGKRVRDLIILAQKPDKYVISHNHLRNPVAFKEPFSIPEATAHDFRHGFATNMVADGTFLIQDISELMGHDDIKTTMKYVHQIPDRIRYLGEVMARRKATFEGPGPSKPGPSGSDEEQN